MGDPDFGQLAAVGNKELADQLQIETQRSLISSRVFVIPPNGNGLFPGGAATQITIPYGLEAPDFWIVRLTGVIAGQVTISQSGASSGGSEMSVYVPANVALPNIVIPGATENGYSLFLTSDAVVSCYYIVAFVRGHGPFSPFLL